MKLFLLQVLMYLCFFSTVSRAVTSEPSSFLDNSYRWQIAIGHLSQSLVSEEKDASNGILGPEKKMTGENFSIYFEIIKIRNENLEWLINTGYEVFSVFNKDSTTFCPSNSNEGCHVKISYLNMGAMPRLKLNYKKYQLWSGLSLNIKQPLSKKASAVVERAISATSAYGVAIGVDIFTNQNLIIPFEIQQQYFLSSNSVKAQQFLIKMGLGRSF